MALPHRPYRDPGREAEIKHVAPDPSYVRKQKADAAEKAALEAPENKMPLRSPFRTSTP